jgi:hypothetical protein
MDPEKSIPRRGFLKWAAAIVGLGTATKRAAVAGDQYVTAHPEQSSTQAPPTLTANELGSRSIYASPTPTLTENKPGNQAAGINPDSSAPTVVYSPSSESEESGVPIHPPPPGPPPFAFDSPPSFKTPTPEKKP